MPDFLSELSQKLVPVATQVGEALYRALKSKPGIEAGVLSYIVPLAAECLRPDTDPSAFEALLGAECESEAGKAVRGYVDWAACAIIRSKGFASRPFPLPDPITAAAIAVKCDATPSMVAFAAARLREMDAVPLLGHVDQGCLIPDQTELERYKDCFQGW